MADNISELQPHLVVAIPGEVHVICIVDIRRLANGTHLYEGDCDKMIQILAKYIVDNLK